MKKICTLFTLFVFLIQSSYAQLDIIGSVDFGRLFDITYDANVSNKLYAVTLQNHIVVSEDNGGSWDILYTVEIGQGAQAKDLRLSPDGSALIFSAYLPNSPLNEIRIYDIASATVIKTFPLPNQDDLAYVISYDVYEDDTDILIVDTNYPDGINILGKTFYTSDGGLNWSLIYTTEGNDTVFINDVAISPTDPEKLYLTRGNGSTGIDGGLFISEDAGQTWDEKLTGIVLDPITFNPLNAQDILMGTGISFGATPENLYRSVDGGENFTIVPISWTNDILNSINVIRYNETDPSQIIILEENEIVISEDGGSTWENFVYPNDDPESYYYGLNASYNPENSEEIFISANYVPLFSQDGGETLTWSKNKYFTSTGNMDLFINDTNQHLYYGVQFGYVHRDLSTSIDTPYDIVPLNIFSNSPGQTQYADKITPNRLYTFSSSFFGSNLKVSDDHGVNKTEILSLFKNNFTAVATFPDNPQKILAAFAGFEPNETELKQIDFNDLNNVVVTDVVLPNLGFINQILIDDAGKIMLSIGVEIYSSEDGGATWTNNSNGLEIMTANDLIFDLQKNSLNSSELAIASSKGIFISTNGGDTWERKTNSLVYNVAFSTVQEGAIIASTYSSDVSNFSLHFSTDSGENWETINNEQLLHIGARSSKYIFNENSVKAYIGTFDLGLIEYTIDLTVLGSPDIENHSNKLQLFPNPTTDHVNIFLEGSHVSQITLYSMSGAQILSTEESSTIDMSTLEAGVYLIRIKDTNNAVFFKRIIKK